MNHTFGVALNAMSASSGVSLPAAIAAVRIVAFCESSYATASVGISRDSLSVRRVVAGAVERHHANGDVERAVHPFEWCRAHLGVAVVDLGIEMIPELVDQTGAHVEARGQTGEAFALEQRFGQPRRDLEILRFAGEGFLAELDDRVPIGRLERGRPLALRCFDVGAARLFDLVEERIVPQVHAAGVGPGDWNSTARRGAPWPSHVDSAGASAISNSRSSRIGNSTSSTSSIFCPTGT